MDSLDTISKTSPLPGPESLRDSSLHLELSSILRYEEIYWKQHSKINRLRERDSNTKFFYLVANSKRNRNFIPEDFVQWDLD